MAILEPRRHAVEPLVLTVPGLDNSGPSHWQSVWERERHDCRRAELGMWEQPHRNTWVNQLNLAIERADRPVVLAAHSLGVHAVAWWAHYEQPRGDANGLGRVIGALLVAPPEVEGEGLDPRLTRFGTPPATPLPFPSILVASRDDRYVTYPRAVALARGWGSWLVDAGRAGHINAESRLGDWHFGQVLLRQLLAGGVPGEEPAHPLGRAASDRNRSAETPA